MAPSTSTIRSSCSFIINQKRRCRFFFFCLFSAILFSLDVSCYYFSFFCNSPVKEVCHFSNDLVPQRLHVTLIKFCVDVVDEFKSRSKVGAGVWIIHAPSFIFSYILCIISNIMILIYNKYFISFYLLDASIVVFRTSLFILCFSFIFGLFFEKYLNCN